MVLSNLVRPLRLGRRASGSPVAAAACVLSLATAAGAQTAPPPPSAQEPPPSSSGLKRLSLEELTRINVISASRQGEILSEAAAAVIVITGDAIRRSGATNIADALRLAIGVSVGRDGYTWAVSARGFQASSTNKMVVLVDGRSVYSPLFSGVFWDAVDLVLADIDRIEVIRGAGGTLWGANAVNGVINVITRRASETQGALVELAAGSDVAILSTRYGGAIGSSGHYRVYGKARLLQSMPYATGVDPDEDLSGVQGGIRFDFGSVAKTSFMLRADGYRNRFAIFNAEDGHTSGFDIVGRLRTTYADGGQLQFQFYYDTTSRRIPVQYEERRHTGDLDLQYARSLGGRNHFVTGVGYQLTHDRVTPGTLAFDPASRTSPLLNVFVQDEITLVTGRLGAVAGIKVEHNDFTGVEYQPTVRLKWTPDTRQMVWGGISRAVRMPTRLDSDLRFNGGTPFVVLTGNPEFRSENVIAREIGYRARVIPKTAFGITVFVNSYSDLRTQEPTPPAGIPIVIDNKGDGRVAGIEFGVTVEPVPAWQLHVSYSGLNERFTFDPDSRDPTGGALEHNDPPHQFRFRSFADLPGRFSLDLTMRWIAALPRPAVAEYGELAVRVARPLGQHLELEFVGDNLLHDRHVEFVNLGPSHAVPRSVFARVTWRSR